MHLGIGSFSIQDGAALEALVRLLKPTEVEDMNFPGGFEPGGAYDGFLDTADDGLEYCLCMVDKRAS